MLPYERGTLVDLIESLEEAAVLLAEIHVRFGAVHILNPECTVADPTLTFGDAARVYNKIAEDARKCFSL